MRKARKKQAEKEMQEKIGLFSKLEDHCLVCAKKFDKQDKEMVQSWYVIVRKEEGKVNLYCPECWTRASNVVNKIKEGMDEK